MINHYTKHIQQGDFICNFDREILLFKKKLYIIIIVLII